MDENEKRRVAKEFMESLYAKSKDIELCKAAIEEFVSASSEHHLEARHVIGAATTNLFCGPIHSAFRIPHSTDPLAFRRKNMDCSNG